MYLFPDVHSRPRLGDWMIARVFGDTTTARVCLHRPRYQLMRQRSGRISKTLLEASGQKKEEGDERRNDGEEKGSHRTR